MPTELQSQLDTVLALAEKATVGVWTPDDHKDWNQPQTDISSDNGTKVARFVKGEVQFWCTVGKAEREWDNAAFIAAACNFIREHGPAIRAAISKAESEP